MGHRTREAVTAVFEVAPAEDAEHAKRGAAHHLLAILQHSRCEIFIVGIFLRPAAYLLATKPNKGSISPKEMNPAGLISGILAKIPQLVTQYALQAPSALIERAGSA